MEAGELLGLLGPNGAGKSTPTKIATGLVRASGVTPRSREPRPARLRRAAPSATSPSCFASRLAVGGDELLALHQSLAGSEGGADERGELLDLVELGDARQTRIDAMSKGMQQRLGIAQALVGAPRLLMLDEPTSALDPVGRRIVRDLLAELRDRGVAVVLNPPPSEVELVCDRVAILNGGRIVARGTPAELARPHGVEIQTGSGLQSFPDARRDEVPAIVAGLVGSGEQVYEVRLLTSTLEDAYLEAVGATPMPEAAA